MCHHVHTMEISMLTVQSHHIAVRRTQSQQMRSDDSRNLSPRRHRQVLKPVKHPAYASIWHMSIIRYMSILWHIHANHLEYLIHCMIIVH